MLIAISSRRLMLEKWWVIWLVHHVIDNRTRLHTVIHRAEGQSCLPCTTEQGRAQDLSLGQDRRAESGVGFSGRGQQYPPHQLGCLGQCWNRAFRSRVNDFGRVGSDRVTGQCDRPGVCPGFCNLCTRFIVAFEKIIRHLGISGILCTLYFHVVLFTSSDSIVI